jgi:hypothetical protein
MMASWKPKHVAKYFLKLHMYFITCYVVTVFNKEIYIINTTGCIHWKLCGIQFSDKLRLIVTLVDNVTLLKAIGSDIALGHAQLTGSVAVGYSQKYLLHYVSWKGLNCSNFPAPVLSIHHIIFTQTLETGIRTANIL